MIVKFGMKQDERRMELEGDDEGEANGYAQDGMRWMEITEKISDEKWRRCRVKRRYQLLLSVLFVSIFENHLYFVKVKHCDDPVLRTIKKIHRKSVKRVTILLLLRYT